MKTLTLTQPWANLVALGEKCIETRSWKTSYRGPLAIHAAKGFPGWAKKLCCDMYEPEFYSSLRVPHGNYSYPELTLGVIVCVTSLIDCVPTEKIVSEIRSEERKFGNYETGRWAWLLGPVEKRFGMAEFPVVGHLGLWDWELVQKEEVECPP